ncbi:MAG: hypothetical protein ACI4TE_02520 [Alphaproteobacteria bacterium]
MNEKLTEKLNQARLLKKHFKLPETVAVLKECLEIDPNCLIAAAQAGLCLLLQGKAQEAEAFFQKAFDGSEKTDLPVGAYLAACMTVLNKESEAGSLLETIRARQADFSAAETYMLAAEMLAEKKQYEQAVRLIDALSVRFAGDAFFMAPVNHYRMIRVLALAGLVDIAEQLADTLKQKTPDSWEGLAAEASVAMAAEKYEEAYSLTVRALQSGGASYPLLAAQQHWLAMNK